MFAFAYTGARNLRAYLIKPIMDEVLVPAQVARSQGLELDALWSPFGTAAEAPESSAAPDAGADSSRDAEAERVARLESEIASSVGRIAAIAAVVLLVFPISHFLKDYLMEWVLGRMLVDIQQALCDKLLALPLSFHHGASRGDVISRTLNDVGRAHWALMLLFTDVVQAGLAALVGGAVLISISWQLSLLAFVCAPLLLGVIAVFGRRIQRSAAERQTKLGDVTHRLVQNLAGIKVIKAFRAEAFEGRRFERENRKHFRRSMRVVSNRTWARTLGELINNGMMIGLMLVGVMVVLRGQWGLTTGDLGAFVFVLGTTIRPTRAMTKGWTQLMEALASADRFFAILDADERIVDVPDAVAIGPVRTGIAFDDVGFAYDAGPPVLRHLDLEVRAGETLAIVGRTGAGKSTLIDLALRLEEPTSGRITIDDVPLERVSRDSLLAQMAVVTQEPFLFAGTIRENIRYGRPEASDTEVEAAARAAHVEEFVAGFERGYDTEVGDLGSKLSVGQKQRITIARAILKNPSVLIFDEATSSLDAKSERYVQEAVEKLLAGRTAIVVAHRLSTIRQADRIGVLENGSISRLATHEELMSEDGLYRELVSLQNAAG